MKRANRCAALIVLIGIVGISSAGCQSQPQGTAADEPAREATAESASGSAGESATSGAASPTAEAPRITADQLVDVFEGSNVFLLDVRNPEEIEEVGTVEGYTNIPIDELEARLDELPKDRPILTA